MVLVDLVKHGRAFQKKKKQKDSLVDRRKMTDDVEVDNILHNCYCVITPCA